MQGFLTIQTLNLNENFIVMGNGVKIQVVAIETFRLFLETGCYLDLFQTLYVPSISRNLIFFYLNLISMAISSHFAIKNSICLKIPFLLVLGIYVMVCIN
jgi:hypothetical protein